MKWKALAACTLAGLALIAAGCGGGDKNWRICSRSRPVRM